MNFRVASYISKLDNLFVLAESIEDDEVKGHFAKYLCVKLSGLLEVFFKAKIADLVDKKSPKPVAHYVNSQFKTFTNIDTRKIVKSLNQFSSEWEEEFNNGINEEQSSAINSVISNRNSIAHGNNSGISLKDVKYYYEKTKEVLGILDGIMRR